MCVQLELGFSNNKQADFYEFKLICILTIGSEIK